MAHRITDTCIFCGACEPECPVNAISPGEDSYTIDETLCVDCVGHHSEAACAAVCPGESIIKV
ncbi:MAG: 4Fe-4S binding protein [Chlorobiaceae bacterium]